jgi:hypothetical protein
MKFIHGYDARYLPGLERQGLWNRDSGLKLTQHFATPEKEKFNILAAKDSPLHRLIKGGSRPFYIDRLQGGTFYHKYDFDRALLREYQDLLGEWFLGIQMHEWGAVLNYDWARIRKQLAGTPPPWTEQQIYDAIKKVSACPWCIHLSCGTPLEYSRKQFSETWRDYLEEMRGLFRQRQTETGGLLLPCDSCVMATFMEGGLGARALMSEVGAQTPLTRLQMAIARGMAKAFGRPWGIYYEPWGGNPFSAPHFFESALNEWRLDNTIFPFDFTAHGPNGGSSRSLQRRIYYQAFMAGAQFVSEEWGVSNTFHNWRDYPLTPYGEIKKDFIAFTANCRGYEPFVPFAIVLPKEIEAVDISHTHSPDSDHYLGRQLDATDRAFFGHVRQTLRLAFAATGKSHGNEAHLLTNSRFGDFFDVVREDVGDRVLKNYSYLVDATPGGAFAQSSGGRKLRTLSGSDVSSLADEIDRIIGSEFPCSVSGGVNWMLGRRGDRWRLGLFNNNGVERSAEKGDSFLPEADTVAVLRFRAKPQELCVLKRWPESREGLAQQADGSYACTLPAGGFHVVEFVVPNEF